MHSRHLSLGRRSPLAESRQSADSHADPQSGHSAPRYSTVSGSERESRATADGTDPDSGHTDGGRDVVSGPGWLYDDGVIGDQPDRQVLVVGDSVVGLTLALLLQRAGYEPLVTTGPDRHTWGQVSYLWAPTARVLEALGVGGTLSERGVTIDAVSVGRPNSPYGCRVLRNESESDGSSPSVVRTRPLREALESRLSGEAKVRDLEVGQLRRKEGGLLVEFENGIREWFDVVVGTSVDAARLRRDEQQPREDEQLVQYEIPVQVDGPSDAQVQERWGPERLVQRVPVPNGQGHLLRITTPAAAPFETIDHERSQPSVTDGSTAPIPPDGETDLAEAVATLDCCDPEPAGSGDPGADLDGITRQRVRQASLSTDDTSAVRRRWGASRVALCGAAACPLAPASGCRTALGVEDGVAFVAALTRNPQSVEDAVAEYAADRSRRHRALRRRASLADSDHDYPLPSDPASPFAALGLVRTVALGPFLGPPVHSLQRDGVA